MIALLNRMKILLWNFNKDSMSGYYKGWHWRFAYLTLEEGGKLDFHMFLKGDDGYETDIGGYIETTCASPKEIAEEEIDTIGWILEMERDHKL